MSEEDFIRVFKLKKYVTFDYIRRCACYCRWDRPLSFSEVLGKAERERKQHGEYLKSRISHPVELVSVNYRERKKHSRIVASISTDWYASLDRAEDELRELARQHGCDMVINVTKGKDTESEPTEKGGTYYYTLWSLAGEAVIR